MHALEINQVNKKYGSFCALKDINFKINQGDFVGLLGVNGAGKTSLIASIAGVNRFEGEIKVMGYDVIKDVVKAKTHLGVVPQEIAFDPFLSVYQTLEFQSGLYGIKNNKVWINELIERMHLSSKAYSNTRSLSGGMKRRLMVAQALVHKPALIILDEPTAGVDVEIRHSLWEFILELHNKGHSILLTTHYLEEVEKLCKTIIMLDKGSIITQNSKEKFIIESNQLPATLHIETEQGQYPMALEPLLIKQEGDNLLFKLENNDILFSILESFKNQNIIIRNINLNKLSLENVFIKYLNR